MTDIDHAEVAATLYRAADLIEERGWTHGALGWGGSESAPLCLEGGILAALGWIDLPSARDEQEAFWGCPAYRAVSDYLGFSPDRIADSPEPVEPIYIFNDTAGRTAAEVIEVLRAAAAIDQSRADALTPAEVSA